MTERRRAVLLAADLVEVGLTAAAGAFYLGAVFGPLYILVRQALVWLKSGHWQHETIADGMTRFKIAQPVFTWVGVQKLWDGFITWPFSLGLFLGGIALACALTLAIEATQAVKRDLARAP